MPSMLLGVLRKLTLAFVAALLPLVAFLSVDTYLHHRADVHRSYAHVNRWGYRGPVLGPKRPGEYRIALVGGSTAFGLGTEREEAIPAVLERLLQQKTNRPVTVVNLAFPADGAYADRWTLRHYRDLNYDAAIIYSGYNDLQGERRRNLAIHRHESAIFRLTGYYPWLPVVLKSKAAEWRRAPSGQTADGMPMVSPGILHSTGAATLEFLAALDRQLRLSAQTLQSVPSPTSGHDPLWGFYREQIDGTIADLLAEHKHVVLVLPPRVRATEDGVGVPAAELHASQQAALRQLMNERFARNPSVLFVDLSDAVNLLDQRYAFHDRVHLNVAGSAIIAARLAQPLTALVR